MSYTVGHTNIGLPLRWVSRKPNQPAAQVITGWSSDRKTCQSRWLGSNMSLARGAKAHVTPSRACRG